MSFAVLWVPDFALHALCRSEPSLVGQPLALTEGEGRKAIVTEVTVEAMPVRPGFTATLAMARCPGVILRQRDVLAEIEAQRLLVAAAFTISPRVEPTANGLCTIDLQGADPRQTEAALRLALVELERAGIPPRAGIAETPLIAGYAARQADPILWIEDQAKFLRPLPLEFANPLPAQAEVLRGWGLKTLGDLVDLSKAEIGARLGTEGVILWERAAGETTRVLRTVEPARSFAAEWLYEPPIESLEPLLFKLRRFAERLALELRGSQLVAQSLSLTLMLEDESDYHRSFQLPEPGTDVESWLRVMQTHFDTVKTTARVIGSRLVAQPTRPPQKQDGLFETGLKDPELFWENLARVAAIVGDDRVGTPVLSDTHRPDAYTLVKPAEVVPASDPAPVHPIRGGVLRRFRPAWDVDVTMQFDQPVHVHGPVTGAIRAWAGPWKLSGDWWHPQAWACEYWHVELDTGAVYRLARTPQGWRVEGVID